MSDEVSRRSRADELNALHARIAALKAENAKLRALLDEFDGCGQYDAMMEGPKFKGWDRSALDRLRPKVRALLQGGPDAG